jgi:homoserine kinase
VTQRAREVAVAVPATSANLGPGFDCLGAALDWRDEHHLRVVGQLAEGATPQVFVDVVGEGAAEVATGADNLVAASLLAGLRRFGAVLPAELHLRCVNTIPHGRGLGSSSAAIVGGLGLAAALTERDVPAAELVALATELEGHPDNVAPAVLGGFTIAWTDAPARPAEGAGDEVPSAPGGNLPEASGAPDMGVGMAVRAEPHVDITPVVAVPGTSLATKEARGLLPEQVPMADAVFNSSRAALLSHAITRAPALLLPATADRLHQDNRAAAYPASHALVQALRERGHAAVISGAGPTVLVLAMGAPEPVVAEVVAAAGPAWQVRALAFAAQGVRPTTFQAGGPAR